MMRFCEILNRNYVCLVTAIQGNQESLSTVNQLEDSGEAGRTTHNHADADQEYQDLSETEGVIPCHRIRYDGLLLVLCSEQ